MVSLITLSSPAAPLFAAARPVAGRAPFLPMSRAEMDALGWDACDVILVTGDAYVDHPSFGMAIVGRLLEAQGFRVGIIAQPDWTRRRTLSRAGQAQPVLRRHRRATWIRWSTATRRTGGCGTTTATRRAAPAANGPDRAVIVYAQRCREAFPRRADRLGGIEASLRRIAHYDYWSDKVRRSVLLDAKADLLLYGNAERALVEVAHRIAEGGKGPGLPDVRGIALLRDRRRRTAGREAPCRRSRRPPDEEPATDAAKTIVIRLPSFEQVAADRCSTPTPRACCTSESNPGNARPLVQRHGDRTSG